MVKPNDTMGPPVAKRYADYKAGTPQRALHDRLDKLFPDNLEPLFQKVGEKVGVQPASASGALYGFLRGSRSLPRSHRRVYVEAGVPEALFAAVELARASGRQPRAGQGVPEATTDADLAELATKLGDVVAAQKRMRTEMSRLRSRIRKLEAQREAGAAASTGSQ